mmetsp:Transcript_19629/g.45708  ORF Transcript_19629/g.45708 Transcript_19629/m.45708 type:complete len:239 (+) Transcript_19629:57-773(+)
MSDFGKDLEVIVEGETEKVSSVILALVSPVFRQMIESGMQESQQRRIELPGKTMSEFRTLMGVIQPLSEVALDADKANFLARWADEYCVEQLRVRCEDILLKCKVGVDSWWHALDCNLPRRAQQCSQAIGADVRPHLGDLRRLGSTLPSEILCSLWPSLCKEAGVDASKVPAPEPSQLDVLLPFICVAIERNPSRKKRARSESSSASPCASRQGHARRLVPLVKAVARRPVPFGGHGR